MRLINKKILVTGAAGFIGYNLLKFLKFKKHNVIGIDNFSRKTINKRKKNNIKPDNYNFSKDVINCSIYDYKKLKKIIEQVDIIVHLAAINGTRNFYNYPEKVFEISSRGSWIIYDILNEIYSNERIKKEILIASSGEVYGQPIYVPTDEKIPLKVDNIFNNRFSYGGGKICQDLTARYMISTITSKCFLFRPHNVYGPNMGFDHVIPELIKKTLETNKTLRIEGTGNETRSFCYIDDFIDGLYRLICLKSKKFDIYNIGNNKEIKIISLAKKITKLLNKKNLKISKGKLRSGGTKKRLPCIKKLMKIGYKPKINIDKGIEKFLSEDEKIKKMLSM